MVKILQVILPDLVAKFAWFTGKKTLTKFRQKFFGENFTSYFAWFSGKICIIYWQKNSNKISARVADRRPRIVTPLERWVPSSWALTFFTSEVKKSQVFLPNVPPKVAINCKCNIFFWKNYKSQIASLLANLDL